MKWYEEKVITVLGKWAVEGIDKHTQESKINCIVYYSYYDEKVEGVAVKSRWVGDYCCPENQILSVNSMRWKWLVIMLPNSIRYIQEVKGTVATNSRERNGAMVRLRTILEAHNQL